MRKRMYFVSSAQDSVTSLNIQTFWNHASILPNHAVLENVPRPNVIEEETHILRK